MNGGVLAIEVALRIAVAEGRPALAAFITGGFPSPEAFAGHLRAIAGAADLVEVGVPFSDPIADGVTIQRASREALVAGTTLTSILEAVGAERGRLRAPVVLMSYLNPLLAYGARRLAAAAVAAGVSGFIVPDLPLEEQPILSSTFDDAGLALVRMVTPATPDDRAAILIRHARGFVYAVAMNGTTGSASVDRTVAAASLRRWKAMSDIPVLAGFGVRTANDVNALVPPADGVIVGSALIEAIESGVDPAKFLHGLVPHKRAGREVLR